MRILQQMLLDESINVNDTLEFTFRDHIFRAHVDGMGFIVTDGSDGSVNGAERSRVSEWTYSTLSKWTRGTIYDRFGVRPRFSAWAHVRHVELSVKLIELRDPSTCDLSPSFDDLVYAYFAPRVSSHELVV